jgi:hypothetical protein
MQRQYVSMYACVCVGSSPTCLVNPIIGKQRKSRPFPLSMRPVMFSKTLIWRSITYSTGPPPGAHTDTCMPFPTNTHTSRPNRVMARRAPIHADHGRDMFWIEMVINGNGAGKATTHYIMGSPLVSCLLVSPRAYSWPYSDTQKSGPRAARPVCLYIISRIL